VLLQCNKLKKSIGVEEILNDVSFILEDKEKAALVGVNGAGKTSVFRLLTGEWTPDSGEIIMPQGTRVGYLPQLNEDSQSGSAALLPKFVPGNCTLRGGLAPKTQAGIKQFPGT
jgi:ATP-binding cassette subfamily F protein 3